MAGAAPHTPFLAFFFLTCAVGRLRDDGGSSAHVISCFFLFGVYWFPFWGCSGMAGAAPHTLFIAFFFLACTVGRLRDGRGGSAHVISCFFLFDVCSRTAPGWQGRLRTRYFLLFPFWRVHAPSAPTAPRTSFPVFTSLFLFIHSYSHFFFFISTIVNIRDNMCTNKNERRRFYVY